MTETSTINDDLPTEVKSKLCSKACIHTVKKYREHNKVMCDAIRKTEENRRETSLIIASFEEQVKAYIKNESQYQDDLAYAKWEKEELTNKLEEALRQLELEKKSSEKIKLDVERLQHASKSVENLVKSQILDKIKGGLGYKSVSPPYNQNYIPPSKDVNEEHVHKPIPVAVTKIDPSINESSEEPPKVIPKVETKDVPSTSTSTSVPIKQVHGKQTSSKKAKKKVKSSKCSCHSQSNHTVRGNQRNWNQQMSQTRSINMRYFKQKACFICGKTNHIARFCFHNPMNKVSQGRLGFQNVMKSRNFHKPRNLVNKGGAASYSYGKWSTQPKIKSSEKSKGKQVVCENSKSSTQKKDDKTQMNKEKVKDTSTVSSKSQVLREIKYFDAEGRPKTTLAWVPKRESCI